MHNNVLMLRGKGQLPYRSYNITDKNATRMSRNRPAHAGTKVAEPELYRAKCIGGLHVQDAGTFIC